MCNVTALATDALGLLSGLGILLVSPAHLPLPDYKMLASVGYTLFGVGLGFYATPSIDAALSNLPAAQAGSGSGIYKMASSLGAAFGVGVSAAIFTARSGDSASEIWLDGMLTFAGREDNRAVREAAIVALGFNVDGRDGGRVDPAHGAQGKEAVMNVLIETLVSAQPTLLVELEALYKDLHRHPELSMQEVRTAQLVAETMQALGYEVTRNVGVTGVVCVMANGAGPTVMLRADMDALPMVEDTGLEYASTVTAHDAEGVEVGVAHSCGHDMHVTWMIGAARVLSANRAAWRGTLMIVFQPGEETAEGARAMVADWGEGRFPKPEIILGQHVMVGPAGTVNYRPGVTLSAGDSLKIKLFGRGSHGSQPQTSIDPVIMAAATTLRLQTIVSREIAPSEPAVLTIGSLKAAPRKTSYPTTPPSS